MNTILQKRIETRAVGIGLEFRDAIASRGSKRDVAEAVATLTQTAANLMAEWLFEHLWISVDEALPEEDIPYCFVAYKALDTVFYSTGSYEKDNKEWFVDGFGFNAEVTHYMPIPSLKGDEE